MAKKKTNQNKKNPIGIIVGTLLIAALIGSIIYLAPKAKDAIDGAIDNVITDVNNQIQDSVNNNAYSGKYNIGAITANGAPTSSKNCFYTKDHFQCKGLNVSLKEDADIRYQIFFYDSEKRFITSTEIMDSNFNQLIEPYYYYARIMFITSVDYQLQLNHLNEHINKFEYSVYEVQDLKFIEGFKYSDGYIKGNFVQMEGTINENSESTHNYSRAIIKSEYSKGIVVKWRKIDLENPYSGITMTIQHPYGYQSDIFTFSNDFLVYEDDNYIAYYYPLEVNPPEFMRLDVHDEFAQYAELYLIH